MSPITHHIDPGFNYALSQVFGASLLKRIDDHGYESKLRELLQRSGLHSAQQEWNLAHSLDTVYDYLKNNYRCEYVYKNEIARQLLLKKHPDKSATLLREVASDKAIADIVIVNGHTIAYEIKTELDNFDRLNNQLESYSKLYDQVFVVTHAGALQTMEQHLLPFVGVIVLDEQTQLTEERPAQEISHLFDPLKAVVTLRQAELIAAWEERLGKLPIMGTASIYGFCREWYEQLDSDEARLVFYKALKSRYPAQHQHELLLDSIKSIKMLLLGRDLPKRLCNTVRERLGLSV